MKEFKYKKLKEQYDDYIEHSETAMHFGQAKALEREIMENYPKVLELLYSLESKLHLISQLAGEDDD